MLAEVSVCVWGGGGGRGDGGGERGMELGFKELFPHSLYISSNLREVFHVRLV